MKSSAALITINEAVTLLRTGHVVAIPTETVYGLAADITLDEAVKMIFTLKQRPSNHPLIIHVASSTQLHDYVKSIPHYAELLMQAFWPGPLTFVLPKTERVSSLVTGGQDTVAVRMPAHPVTLELIKAVGHPLAAPSANKFGSISPTRAEHVVTEFDGEVKVVEGGACHVGIESTIIDATDPKHYVILREGQISRAQLQAVTGQHAELLDVPNVKRAVSGNLDKHYAPQKPLFIFNNRQELDTLIATYSNVCVLSFSDDIKKGEIQITMPRDSETYARVLYHNLRIADQSNCNIIALESPPYSADWVAIHDRLKKASYKI